MGVTERLPGGTEAWIGRPVAELPTPALVLDATVARRNAAEMAERFQRLPADLRPHVKVHKCVELARLQLEHGAIGVTTATVTEASAMAAGGVEDILIANEIVDPVAVDRVIGLAERARVTVAVDAPENVDELARRVHPRGVTLGVLVEFDVGMGRGGARTAEAALDLGRSVHRHAGLEFRGLLGYEGHCASEPDPALRDRYARESMDRLVGLAERFRAGGLPVPVVSAGATGTYATTGAHAGVTEVQAGSYLLMDGFHAPLVDGFGFALHVIATAISVHGDLAVFDAGRKAVGADFGPPLAPDGLGRFDFLHEEHLGFRYGGPAPYRVGDRVALVPAYAPTAVNLFPALNVVEDGYVVDRWQVRARHGEA
jgi:D-serine deaminase-like pyridoxal phosphate-dependent protein